MILSTILEKLHFGRCILRFEFPLRAMFFPMRGISCGLPLRWVFHFSDWGGYRYRLLRGCSMFIRRTWITRIVNVHQHRVEWTGMHWNEVCARRSCWMFQPCQFSRARAFDGEWCACCSSSTDVQIANTKYISTSYSFPLHRTELEPEPIFSLECFSPINSYVGTLGVTNWDVMLFEKRFFFFSCPLF